ncbi:MAG: hypothetical protein HY240_03095 [Actinobacteria bacterium]|nr:hypothetical protein [Actinomycetota bacterium]
MEQDRDEPEVIDRDGRYALTLEAAGYAIRDLDQPAEAEALWSFPRGDEGFEAAWARYTELLRAGRRAGRRWVRFLRWVVAAGVAVWVVSGLGIAWIYIFAAPRGSFDFSGLYRWVTTADSASYHMWLGALVLLVVAWLKERLIDGGAEPRRRPATDDDRSRSAR